MGAKQVSLMFHRVSEPGMQGAFLKYLDYLVQTFPIIVPGEPLVAPVSISLIFDDAYIDFYEYVFPLLKKYNIKALLAVPVSYISEKIEEPMKDRMLKTHYAGIDKPSAEVNTAFCSWIELKEMVDSGYVIIASHTQTHCSTPALNTHEEQLFEIMSSKKVLEEKLGTIVEHFIYPYGHWSRSAHRFVTEHYRYTHRIGGALNDSKQLSSGKLLYRIDANDLFINHRLINAKQLRIWWFKALWNRIRFK